MVNIVTEAIGVMPASGWFLAIGKKKKKVNWESMFGGETCGTVTPPSADCESSIRILIERIVGGGGDY